ncbi:HlyD family type I secretion periplasmic adaptor subunit [Oceanicella actignis]|uniref:Membrane fusion protein (MFP) family protein n=1 Tax=Oceanicella actignis TaxID=1189325 RepID=A0A1M7T4I9_9RHOB|nr:HlyD family type I secretion periplasmic adaptor subunit [Oceanicella actignis]SET41655.1 membrane fusion protein, adhesin transport system [Oceanicella actignis]SHN65626.1 membrane fusion protein, adhesin transport system [Oceanicella actignis]
MHHSTVGLGHAPRAGVKAHRGAQRKLELEERRSPGALGRVALLLSAAIVAFLIWAAYARMPELARAEGEVAPLEPIHRVQHLEGGVLADLRVKEGQRVRKGDVLAVMDADAARAEMAQLEARLLSLDLALERIAAHLEGRAPDFKGIAQRHPEGADAAAAQLALFEGEREALARRLAILDEQAAAGRSQLEAVTRQQAAVAVRLGLLDEELAMREELLQMGHGSRAQIIEASVRRNVAQSEGHRLEGERERLSGALEETERRRAELLAAERAAWLDRRVQTLRERAEVRAALDLARSRVEQAVIRAPSDGVVRAVSVQTVGGVLAPGAELAQIAPPPEGLRIVARIAPRDIGAVKVGEEALIRLPAFDYAKPAKIEGRVTQILPQPFEDPRKGTYFKAFVEVPNWGALTDLGLEPAPGMAAGVDIVTGSKPLLEYLFKPLRYLPDRLFSER